MTTEDRLSHWRRLAGTDPVETRLTLTQRAVLAAIIAGLVLTPILLLWLVASMPDRRSVAPSPPHPARVINA